MAKRPRLTAAEAERILFAAGFVLMRSKGTATAFIFGQVCVWLFHFIAVRFCTQKSCSRSFQRLVRFEDRICIVHGWTSR